MSALYFPKMGSQGMSSLTVANLAGARPAPLINQAALADESQTGLADIDELAAQLHNRPRRGKDFKTRWRHHPYGRQRRVGDVGRVVSGATGRMGIPHRRLSPGWMRVAPTAKEEKISAEWLACMEASAKPRARTAAEYVV